MLKDRRGAMRSSAATRTAQPTIPIRRSNTPPFILADREHERWISYRRVCFSGKTHSSCFRTPTDQNQRSRIAPGFGQCGLHDAQRDAQRRHMVRLPALSCAFLFLVVKAARVKNNTGCRILLCTLSDLRRPSRPHLRNSPVRARRVPGQAGCTTPNYAVCLHVCTSAVRALFRLREP